MKIDRLLAITILLINRKRITAKELAEQFEVSVRTIHRDMEAISQAGIPVVSYQGSNGGYGVMEEYKFDNKFFTFEDTLSIITALKGANSTLDDKQLTITLEKIKGLIPENQLENVIKRSNQFIIDLNHWGFNDYLKKNLHALRNAIAENKLICFDYTNIKGESYRRIVEPLVLTLKRFSWYLYGYCRVRNDFRVFKLSRIKQLEIKEEQFSPKEINQEALQWENQWKDAREPTKLVLKFKSEVRARVEDSFDEKLIETQADSSIIVTVSYPEDDWLYGIILSYADNAEVLEPPHIKDIIKEKGKRIWEMYKN